jgi:hypothetical protein
LAALSSRSSLGASAALLLQAYTTGIFSINFIID